MTINKLNYKQLDDNFLSFIKQKNPEVFEFIINERSKVKYFSEKINSTLLKEAAILLEEFIIRLFPEFKNTYYNSSLDLHNQYIEFKKIFINKYIKLMDISILDGYSFKEIKLKIAAITNQPNITFLDETKIIQQGTIWLKNEEIFKEELFTLQLFAGFIFHKIEDGGIYSQNHTSIFSKIKKRNFNQLVHNLITNDASKQKKREIKRENFSLFKTPKLDDSFKESSYCIKCELRDKEHCKRGFYSKEETKYKENPLGEELHGCPLSMDISKMHELNQEGKLIAALGVITINNPLVAGTGYNICNDCISSCIFQSQEPCDTPKVETQILKEVLFSPYGFEIYYLLTKWNPLRFYRPFPKEKTGYNVLVVGAGPAGYSLSYNLLQEGHNVFMVDALKIEPLHIKSLIKNFQLLYEDLDTRVIAGFGGVSEYGITSRWDKNLLKVIRIILEREENFLLQGSIHFGQQITFEDCKSLGFHHIALCQGAGKPNILNIDNGKIEGIRTASDFLMNLNMGAYKKDNLFNLQINLPLVVVGGGLTAVDACTESITYYIRQIKKHIPRYLEIIEKKGKEYFLSKLNEQEKNLLTTYLQDYDIIKNNPKNASNIILKNKPVYMLYHKSFEESKAYKINANELDSGLKQGMVFIENAKITKILTNNFNQVTSIEYENQYGETNTIKVNTIIVATGTSANDITLNDYKSLFTPEALKLKASEENIKNNPLSFKNKNYSILLDKIFDKTYVSFFGDMHPIFSGSVVKAIASGFYGQYEINNILEKHYHKDFKNKNFIKLKNNFIDLIKTTVVKKEIINNNIFKITLKNHSLVKNIQCGQFIKLQASVTTVAEEIEPVVLTPIEFDKQNSLLSCVILKNGSSSLLLDKINTSQIIASGPLGSPTKMLNNSKICLIATSVANTSTLNILQGLRIPKLNNYITYISGFKTDEDMFSLDKIKTSDNYLITSEKYYSQKYLNNPNFMQGNILDALETKIDKLKEADFIFLAGSNKMMEIVSKFLQKNQLSSFNAMASVNYPMNCALKGICSNCIAFNKKTQTSYYACQHQEQNIQDICFTNLAIKLRQNSLQEKISNTFKQLDIK